MARYKPTTFGLLVSNSIPRRTRRLPLKVVLSEGYEGPTIFGIVGMSSPVQSAPVPFLLPAQGALSLGEAAEATSATPPKAGRVQSPSHVVNVVDATPRALLGSTRSGALSLIRAPFCRRRWQGMRGSRLQGWLCRLNVGGLGIIHGFPTVLLLLRTGIFLKLAHVGAH